MRSEPRVVQLLDGILHVLVAQELHHSCAILVRVGEAHIARLAHMVLQILPRPRSRQSGHHHTELRALRYGAPIAASLATAALAAALSAVAARAAAARKLDAQAVPVVVVAVARFHRVFGVAVSGQVLG